MKIILEKYLVILLVWVTKSLISVSIVLLLGSNFSLVLISILKCFILY